MGNVCSVAKSWRNCKKMTFFRHLRFPVNFYVLKLKYVINFKQFPFCLDKRELKEWKKMVEKQLAEKVRESCDAEVNYKALQCFGKKSENSALKLDDTRWPNTQNVDFSF